MNKKGSLDTQIIFVLMLVVVISVIIFLIWGGATIFPLAVGSGQAITNTINDAVQKTDSGTSLGNASQVAATTSNNILGSMEFVVYAIMIGLLLGFIAVCYYVRTLKILAPIWFIVIVCMVVIAMIVSNAYIQASSDPALAGYYETWGSNNFLMTHLPMIIAVFGVFSGLLLFVIMQRDPEEEDSAL